MTEPAPPVPPSRPAVGDRVSHDGTWPDHEDGEGPYLVTAVERRYDSRTGEPVLGVQFENSRYRATALGKELVWSEVDRAWYLPGRLFSVEQRQAARLVLNIPADKPLTGGTEAWSDGTPSPADDYALRKLLEDTKRLGAVDDIANHLYDAKERAAGAARVRELLDQGHTPEAISKAAIALDIDLPRLKGREQRAIAKHLRAAPRGDG